MNKFSALLMCLTLMAASAPAFAKKLKAGEKFPAFSLGELKGKGTRSLTELKGKVVLVDFWASWCEPCKKELPALNDLAKSLKGKGVEIVGINVDDEKKPALEFLKSHPVTLPILYDDGKKLVNQVGVPTMPTSFVIDKSGVVRFVHAGFHEDEIAKFKSEIAGLLK